uniref:Retinoic acid receptor responder protein 2 n=1 Tax=Bos mutus grunniens TaxID=30521 RepID=A0A8B9XX97_BOSMU
MVRIRGWSLVYQKTGVTGGQGGGGGSRPCSPAAGPRTGADPAPTSDRANLGWAWEQWGQGPGEGGEAMWQLLLPLALGLGTMGLGRAELTTAQHRGLQVALEEFHKHPPVLWAFQVTSVDNAADTLFPAGQFVRLEFKLQQTSCRKKDWRKEDCKVKPNGRKRKCLACIKLDSKDQVLGRMVHCPIQTQVQRELDDAQDAQCSRVERAGEDPHSYYLPGQFAFIKALSP